MSIFRKIYEDLQHVCYIWRREMQQVIKDEGILIFFFVVPIAYPLLYSWIYNNETVHEVPVCVVDMSNTGLSREFVHKCDASPDIRVAYYAQDLDEGKSLVSRHLVKGVYFIPPDFETNVLRMKQAVVSVYCDMSLMLTYKAIFQTSQLVSMEMGKEIQNKMGGRYTAREEAISARPLDYEDVPIFNPKGGYGSFVLPAVLILILQQTLVLGIGLSAGTAREENPLGALVPVGDKRYESSFAIVIGKSLCYLMIYAVMGAWLVAAVPRIFHFPMYLLWYRDVVSGQIQGECHAYHGVRLRAVTVPNGCLVASEQYPGLVARCLVALPQHVWCTCLCPHEFHGGNNQRRHERIPHPMDPSRCLFHLGFGGLSLSNITCPPLC